MNLESSKQVHIHREKNDTNELIGSEQESALITYQKLNPLTRLIKWHFFIPFLYVVATIFLFFSLLTIFMTYVLRLKVETAVVSAEIETMTSPVSGYVKDIYVVLGDQVKKGTPLLTIEDLNLERKLQLARVRAEESRMKIGYYKQLFFNEKKRLKIYQKIGHNRVASAQSLVNITKQKVLMAHHNLERFSKLYKKHYISKASWEVMLTKYMSKLEELKNAEAQENLQNNSLNAIDKGMYFTGSKTEGIEHDLYAEVVASEKRAQLDDDRVKIYEKLINKLTLKAPFDGKVTQILKSVGNTTDNIKPIIFIENTQISKNVIAYLTQDEVIRIGVSKKVKIYIPSSDKTYTGKIMEINRTDGFIDIVKAQYRWRDFQIDKSARVTIDVPQSDRNNFNNQAFPGMPAIVYFSKKITL